MGGSLTQNSVVWGGGGGQLQDLALTTKCEGHPPPALLPADGWEGGGGAMTFGGLMQGEEVANY